MQAKKQISCRRGKKRVLICLTRSAPIQARPFPQIDALCIHWKNKGYRTVIDVGCGKLRNALKLVRHFRLWICDFQEVLEGDSVASRLRRLRAHRNFLGFVPAQEFANSKLNADAAVLAYVLHTLPTAPMRRSLLRSAIGNTTHPHEVFVAVPNGEYYYRQRMAESNRLDDGYFFHADDGSCTFYREYSSTELDGFMKRAGFLPERSFGAEKKNQKTYVLED